MLWKINKKWMNKTITIRLSISVIVITVFYSYYKNVCFSRTNCMGGKKFTCYCIKQNCTLYEVSAEKSDCAQYSPFVGKCCVDRKMHWGTLNAVNVQLMCMWFAYLFCHGGLAFNTHGDSSSPNNSRSDIVKSL